MRNPLLDGFEEIPVQAEKPVNNSLLEGFQEVPVSKVTTFEPNALADANITSNMLKGLFPEGKTFDTAVRVDQGNLEWALNTYKGVSPEVAAKVQKISKQEDLSFETTMANKEEWTQWQEAQDIYSSLLEKDEKGVFKYPFTANWLNNPDKIAVSKDDVEALKEIEKLLNRQSQKDEGFLKSNVRAFRYGSELTAANVAKIPALAYSTVKQAGRDILGTEADIAPPDWLLNNPIANYFEERARDVMPIDLENDIINYIKKGDIKGAANNWALQISANAPNSLLAIGSFLAGVPQVGLGLLGGLSGAAAFEEGLGEGKTTEQAISHGLLSGTAEVAFESIGTFGILKTLEKKITQQAGKAISKAFFKEVGLSALVAGGQEGGEELGTEFAQSFSDFITGDDEAFQGVIGRSINAGLVGFGSGVGMGGGGTVLANVSRGLEFKRNKENFDNLEKAVTESKTTQRSPENTQEFIEDINLKVDTDPNIYLDNEGVQTLFQEKPKEFNEFAEKMGITKDLPELQETGADVPVDKSKYLANYAGTDLSLELNKYIKFEPSGVSLSTEKANQQEFENQLELLRNRAAALEEDQKLPQQVEAIRNTLLESGKKASDVDAQLGVLMSGAKVLSQKRGESVKEWFNRVNPELQLGRDIKDIQKEGISYNQETGDIVKNENFNKWFGDSKVVDEKGSPLVVYHGSPNEFTTFDYSKIGELGRQEGSGFYFTTNKDIASGYAKDGKIFQVYLNIKKPMEVDRKGFNKKELTKLLKEVVKKESEKLDQDIGDGFLSNFGDVSFQGFGDVLNEAVENILDEELAIDQLGSFVGAGLDVEVLNRAVIKTLKYDGIVSDGFQGLGREGGKIYIALTPNQIKSVDNQGTFATDTANILKQEEDKIVRGGVSFTDTKTTINLFKSANLSTFLHETAHIFSNDIQELIKTGKADDQLKADYDTILKFVDGKLDVAGEEKFARGFEAYLREGKAPTTQLARAFEKFKQWLTNIYRSIKDLDIEINDEIRGVFDRILASQEEVAEAQTYYGLRESLASQIKVNKKQKVTLEKKQEKAITTSNEKQIKKSLQAYTRAIGGKKAYKEQAVTEINEMPVYKATDMVVKNGSFDSIEIESQYGKETVDNLKTKNSKLTTKKGVVSVAEISLEFEYNNEQDLMDALTVAPKKQVAINARALELENNVEKNIREVQESQEEVLGEESVHNNDSFDFLVAEAQVLKEKIAKVERNKVVKIERQAIKDEAYNIVYNKQVKNATRYDLFAKTEQKFAKQAVEFAKNGEFLKSYRAKEKQVLNHALVQEAVKARDQKLKIERRYSKKNIDSSLKNVENSYADIVIDLLNTYRIVPEGQFVPSEEGVIKRLKELDEVLYSETPDWIINGIKPEDFNNYRDLTMNQLVELDDTIKSFATYGRNDLKTMKDTQYKTIEEVIDKSIENMDNLPDRKVVTDDDNLFVQKPLNLIRGLIDETKMTEFVFERLDNYSLRKTGKFGVLGELINEGVAAEVKYNDIKNSLLTKKLEVPLRILTDANTRLSKKYNSDKFDIKGVPVTPDMRKAGKTRWTGERIISFVLNMGNKGNFDALVNSYGYTAEQMNLIAGELTVKELESIQNVWDGINGLFPELNRVHFNIYNRNIEKVSPQALVVTNFNNETIKLKGGYYPLQYDHDISIRAAQIKTNKNADVEDILKNRQKNVFNKTTPADGFKYSRVPGHSLPPLLELGVLISHINNTARYISHAEYLRDLNRITLNNEWVQKFQDKSGKKLYSEMRKWVGYQALPERNVSSGWDRGLDKVRSLSTTAILGANIAVGVKQRISLFNAARKIGWKYIGIGVRRSDLKNVAFGLESSKEYQNVIKLSGYMRLRPKNIDRELSDIMNKFTLKKKRFNIAGQEFTLSDIRNFMFEWIKMNDRATVIPVWKGAFQKYVDEHIKGYATEQEIKEAIKFADNIVRTTQPSTLPIDLNSLQRSEGMMRLFTSFMTFTFKLGNNITGEYQAFKDGAITRKEYMRHVMYDIVMPGWSLAVVSALFYSGGLPKWWEFVTAPFEVMASWIPFVRDIAGFFKYGREFGNSPAFEGANRTLKAIKSTGKGISGDRDWSKVYWDLGYATEYWVGVPALKFAKQLERNYKNIIGEN